MEAHAHVRHLKMAPRKVSVVAALIRGMEVGKAIHTLRVTRRAAATPVRKVIESAIANASDRSRGQVDIDALFIKQIVVHQGPTARRFMPRAMGRASRINKKTSHIDVVVSDGKA